VFGDRKHVLLVRPSHVHKDEAILRPPLCKHRGILHVMGEMAELIETVASQVADMQLDWKVVFCRQIERMKE
jgi:hypothetical protein